MPSMFDDLFADGATDTLLGVHGSCGRVVFQPTDGEPIRAEAIVHPEEKTFRQDGIEQKAVYQRTIRVRVCSEYTIKLHWPATVDGITYEIEECVTPPSGLATVTLIRSALRQAINPKYREATR
jgi:hypothetical protein